MPDPQILALVEKHKDNLEEAVQALIKAACDNGGKDNVTVVLVKYLGK